MKMMKLMVALISPRLQQKYAWSSHKKKHKLKSSHTKLSTKDGSMTAILQERWERLRLPLLKERGKMISVFRAMMEFDRSNEDLFAWDEEKLENMKGI